MTCEIVLTATYPRWIFFGRVQFCSFLLAMQPDHLEPHTGS